MHLGCAAIKYGTKGLLYLEYSFKKSMNAFGFDLFIAFRTFGEMCSGAIFNLVVYFMISFNKFGCS